ncbi:LOW QUALITY PROTEIN: plectin-like [Heterodontus francisci]|uniref:LOW QUALITY PROTEIN: plectin-like n=1 Tax=Heterodontus francisci TaxID=7792 RepID=UPI00355B2AA1
MSVTLPSIVLDSGWLQFLWVSGLVSFTLTLWLIFLFCGLRSRQQEHIWINTCIGTEERRVKRSKSEKKNKRTETRKQVITEVNSHIESDTSAQQPCEHSKRNRKRKSWKCSNTKDSSAKQEEVVEKQLFVGLQGSRMDENGHPTEGTGSPIKGDTLPWNLAKHQRSKQSKVATESGRVLDPAERAIIRIADERDRVQKKTFTKWVNKHLMKAHRSVSDLYEDLRDGHNLISLLEVLSGDSLPREKGRMRFHKLQNVGIALEYLKHRQVRLVNIRNDDIADGNPKLTLGLIWTIILHFQISDIQVSGQSDDMTAKEKLLLWSQRMVEGYPELRCDNFTSSWRDGKLFNAVIHRHRPVLIDMNKVYRQKNHENLEQAFTIAERELGVTRLLDPEDVDVPHPDEKSIITYVSSLYDALPRVPNVEAGVRANEIELRWQEYYEMVTLLLQWIRHHISMFEERKFPGTYEEMEVLWRQFLKFKESDLPSKEIDKNHSKTLFKNLEGAVQEGHLKVPVGYHPFDVEKEWGKLHVSILERERVLRSEFERLERFQRIVLKIQQESSVCEEQLKQSDTILKSDIRLLNAGKQAQNTAVLEHDLDKADSLIRILFNDVQTLKDGRHPQAEQMYRRVFRLHEFLVATRTDYSLRFKSGAQPPIQSITLLPTSKASPAMDGATLKYIQDLLEWIEENQRRLEVAEWGVDLPTVQSQLGGHRGQHQSIEDFRAKIERARADQLQLSPANQNAYQDYLGKLDLQYAKLLNSSKSRLRNLESLNTFVSMATKELMWLNDKEEEEVNYDWSERNTNMAAKKDNYSGLMKELELKEKKVNSIQNTGDKLLRDGHPAKQTIEAFMAALQTQWSWILQLCCCIEAHLKENTAYFQYFSDVKDAENFLKKLQDSIKKKYSCDRSITVTRLEDLIQDSIEEKEQLSDYKSHLTGLSRRAKSIVQLKPRNPAHPLKANLLVQAVCDYKQMEITVNKADEYISAEQQFSPGSVEGGESSGNEALVPSICFIVPPANKEALDTVNRLEITHQTIVNIWHQVHIDMTSLLPWLYLNRDMQQIRSWNLLTFRSLNPEDYKQILPNLELHYQDFMRESQDSLMFGPDDRIQIEREYKLTIQHFEKLQRSSERGEQDELNCKKYVTQLKDIRLQLEGCEKRTIHKIRQPLDKEPLTECKQRISEQQLEANVEQIFNQIMADLYLNTYEHTVIMDDLHLHIDWANQISNNTVEEEFLECVPEAVRVEMQQDLDNIQAGADKCSVMRKANIPAAFWIIFGTITEPFVTSSGISPTPWFIFNWSIVSSYGCCTLGKRLKTIDVVIRSTQEAEDLVKKYETRLREVNSVPPDTKSLESYKQQLKGMRVEVNDHQPLFENLESELSRAKVVNERMIRSHSERDVDLDRYRECVQHLLEHWQGVQSQIDTRCRELEQLGRQLSYYREAHNWLIQWIQDTKERQEKIQAVPIRDRNSLKQQLQQQQKVLQEVEKNREKVDECEKFAKQYIDAIKDYELQLVTYKAQIEPVASPVKKQKVVSASDTVIQEYVDLRTRYIELMTLSSQYIKFITVNLHRLENEEKAAEKLKAEEKKRLEEVEAQLAKQKQLAAAHAKAKTEAEKEAKELQQRIEEEVTKREAVAVNAEQQKQNVQQELNQLKSSSVIEIKKKTKMVEEVLLSRTKIEEEIRIIQLQLETSQKQKTSAESELQQLKARAQEADKQRKAAQDEAERLRKQVKDESQKKKQAEEELKLKIQAEKDAAREKQKALEDLQHFKNQAAEVERRMKQAEVEKEKQLMLAQEMAQKSATAELQSKRISFEQKTTELEISLKQEHQTVTQLQEEATQLKRQQEDAENAKKEAEKELEKWRQKANEALRLRLQAEEVAHKKSLAQEEAERQKEDADREARRRAKTEESALRQKEMAEQELDKQRKLADETAQQKLSAEQELIRLRAETENGEQQRLLLEEELYRLKNEVNEVLRQRKLLEEELAKVKAEMEILLQLKMKTEEDTRSNSEKTKQMLEKEAQKMKELADEAVKLRAVAEEAKRQRQLAEDEVIHQRSEAERILKEKLMAINEATRLKTEAEMALKEKEAENERLRRMAEDETYQRKLLEEQAMQHKQDIEERIVQLRKSSDLELDRQKVIVDETLKHRRVIEEEIRILKLNFEKASEGKSDLEIELNKLKNIAEETQRSKQEAEKEAERQRGLALEEAKKRQEAERKVKEILAAEEEAARQRKAALDEVERLKRKSEEAWKQKEVSEKEAKRQISLAQEAAQKRIDAEEKAHQAAVQQKEQELLQTKKQEKTMVDSLKEQAENAKHLAEEAEQARLRAEQDATFCRQQAEEAERLKQLAEKEAQEKAKAQQDAEKLRKEAELEAAKRAQAEQAALKQKQMADADMEKHKKFAEQTLRQKSGVEQELVKVKLQLEETDHQKSILDEELQRLKSEVTEAIKQKNQAEGELHKVKIQMEEVIKVKMRIEKENKMLLMKDKENTQKHLTQKAEEMKLLAEEAARLSVEAQETARQRKLAEEDLAEQRTLADKMLKEKMQAIQEASRLKAEAEMLQKQRDHAQEQAKKLSQDKQQMQQRLDEEAEEFQKLLFTERKRQMEISEEAQHLKTLVTELSEAQAKAEKEANKFKNEAKEISLKLRDIEETSREKNNTVEKLEFQWIQSKKEASELQDAIAELENEKEKLRQEAELLQQRAKKMEAGKREEIAQTTQILQQTFISEKELLLKKEKMVEEEKKKLERLYEDELKKSNSLKDEQSKQLKKLEDDKFKLQTSMEDALRKQREAEEQIHDKQRELQEMEERRQEKEKQLADENQSLREMLEQLKAQKMEEMAKEKAPIQAVTVTPVNAVSNGRDMVDSIPERENGKFCFDGLRQPVTASRLQQTGILSKKQLDKLKKGSVTVKELSQKENLKNYLQGKSCIAGLIIEATNEEMSIYQAMKQSLLKPTTATILLEAQAASGFIIDPIKGKKLSVNEAIKEGVVGPELQDKLLSAERAVTGYRDPYTGNKISLFEAMKKDLISLKQGIRLLQAQMATGGIIDPMNSHRLPLVQAYKQGIFDEDMNKTLGSDSDETKGFFDPNTQENLMYWQLMDRCIKDSGTGLCLLPLSNEAVARKGGYTTEQTEDIFSTATVSIPSGRFSGKTVTIWEVINSEYFTEEQRRDLIRQYRSGKVTIENIIKFIITIVDETETKKQLLFDGLRDKVPASELLDSKIIDKKTFDGLQKGKTTPEDVGKLESVRKFLQGSESIAGVFVEPTKEKMSFYEAMKKNLLSPTIAEALLESQAASGFIVDPVQNRTLTVDEAVKEGLVGPEVHEKLLSAERAVTGYKDPYTGRKISLFEAIKKNLLHKDHGIRLLDAQLASGGIIDSENSHRLPIDVAYKRGMFDEEMNQMLSTPSDDNKGFYDPNTEENLSYQELKDRCRKDDKSGLLLLPLSEKAVTLRPAYDEEQTKDTFRKTTVSVPAGTFTGKTVTIWELINSEYFTDEQRRELIRQYRSGKVTVEKIIKIVITVIEETEAKKKPQLLFDGLRDKVPASELLDSKIIDKKTFDGLQKGKTTPEDVGKLESVRKFLQGSESIAGVFVEPTKEKMSFYEAMKKNLLRPRIAEALLEAQAASGFIVDPVQNRTLTVDEAVKEGLVGPELHEKLLSAEKAVTGYTDPYTGHKISLFEAMRKDLIPKDHGIHLLEAQLSSGGIINPLTSHRLPLDAAFKRGMFDEDMNTKLSTPSDDIKGFTEPNTDESVTYQQLKQKCRTDPETSLYLLPLTEEAIKQVDIHPEEVTKDTFQKATVSIPSGKFSGKTVTIWEVINSEYFTEEQRRDLIRQYRSGKVTIENIIKFIITIVDETETKKQLLFDGLRDKVPASELLDSKIIDKKTFDGLQKGKTTPEDVGKLESVRKFLQGSDSIAGVFVEPTKEKMSFYEAMKKNLLSPTTAEALLESQAASGFIVDPVQNRTLTVDEAVKEGLVGPEVHEKLLSAERAVTGYKDPYTGRKISLFEAIKKNLLHKDHGIRLLDAQLASGGIIDSENSHRLPIDVAYKRGMFDEEMNQMLSTPSDDNKGFYDPNTEENLSYQELKDRCRKDDKSGLLLLPLSEKAVTLRPAYDEEQTKDTFRKTTVSVPAGTFTGKTVTIWELINSEYFTDEQRRELIRQYRSGKITVEKIIKIVITVIEETEAKKKPQLLFDGLRDKVPASELLDSKIIDKKTFDGLQKGKTTPEDVGKLESVRKFLQGSESIAGVFVEPTKEKMSFYEAMKKNLLRPRIAEALLEAQAASGFIVDPVQNRTLTVDEAVKEGLVGPELHEKLLSAEKAVTGYTDPYTGHKISLFEAMRKDLIPKDHGIHLLEAQLSSGGIINPLTSHRLPLDAAFKRGMFDEDMNKKLSTPSDDIKGFTEPNTDESVTYQQLKQKCRTDPETSLYLLPLTEEAIKQVDIHPEEVTKDTFQKATVSIPSGKFSGKTVTIWEVINSEYFTEEQRRDLIRQYRSGKVTVEKIISIVVTIIEESEVKKKPQITFDGLRDKVPASELLDSKIIDKKTFDGLQKGKTTPEDVGKLESVRKFLQGSESIAGVFVEPTKEKMSFYEAMKKNLLSPTTAEALLESQAASGFIVDPVQNRTLTVDEAVKEGLVGPEVHEKLLSAERAVTGYMDPYTGRKISLFEAIKKNLLHKDHGIRLLDAQLASGGIIDSENSHRLPIDVAYKRGMFDEEMNQMLSTPSDDNKGFYDPNTEENLSYQELKDRCRKDDKSGLLLLPLSEKAVTLRPAYDEEQTKDTFRKTTVSVPAGTFTGKTVTIWELINSEYFTDEQRRELIRQYRSGKVTVEKIIKIVITVIEETEAKKKPQLLFDGLRDKVPASELLDSKIIDKKTFDGLQKGKTTPEDVGKLESVRKFLQGSDSIAGVFVEPTKEKMSFYEAMKKNLLSPTTAEALLEAQAASGFIVDPVQNRTLTVDEAVKEGLVGPELHEKLLSAEKAVTGYTDPYTGHKISLYQAIKKDLVSKDHGVHLLEAQIATGGIIDSVTSHRLPVDVAYKRGMFDEEMSRILSDADDDIKGFVDPNTDENLMYQQLKERCVIDPDTGLSLIPMKDREKPRLVESMIHSETETREVFENTMVDLPESSFGGKSMSIWEILNSEFISEKERLKLTKEYQTGKITHERLVVIIIEIIQQVEIRRGYEMITFNTFRGKITADQLYASRVIDLETLNMLKEKKLTVREVCEMEPVRNYLFGTRAISGIYKCAGKAVLNLYQAMKKGWVKPEPTLSLLEAQAATGFILDPVQNKRLTVDEAVREGVVGPELHDKLLSAERAVTGYRDPYSGKIISLFQAMKKGLIMKDYVLRLLDAQLVTGGIIDPEYNHHLPLETAYQRGYLDRETYSLLTDPTDGTQGFRDPITEEALSYSQLMARCKVDENTGHRLLTLTDKKRLMFQGLRKQVTIDQLVESNIIARSVATQLQEGETTIEDVSNSIKKYLEGTSCISGVFVEASKERLSIYQAMKKGMIRPGTAFELLEAQAATGYMIDPVKNMKLTVSEAVKMGVVGPEFKDKLLSAERAVTGYRDPYSGALLSLFQAMQKGLILKDHGIRLLESQIATGGIIDPEYSHRLPVEVAYKRDLFDEEMNRILSDPGDDTKGFFDPNTEENLTYLQLKERCVVDSDSGLCLLPLKDKKRERKTSSKSSVRKRRVVIVDPETGKEMSVYEAYRKGLIDHQTYTELSEQECEWEEVTISSSDGVVKSMITDRRSGRQYDIDDALSKGLIDQGSLDLYRSGALSITEFADMLSGNMSGFRSRSSSVGSSSSYTGQQAGPMRSHMVTWSDPTEETGPVAGILDTDTLEKVSITEAMHRNLVDNISGQRLLEAQACTGGIIDPNTGDKYSVADAVGKSLVDKIMVDRINLAQKAFNGFEDPRTKTKMSAAQALKKGWLYYEAGQRFLEVQYLTGGLIEPDIPGRVLLDEALQKGTIDARTAQKLRDVGAYAKYITCPKTKLKISYKDAMDRSMIEEGTGLRLLEASSQSTKGFYSPYNMSGAGSSAGSRSGSRTGSRTGSRRGSFDATGSGYSMSFSSSSYTSSSYGRRLAASVPGGREMVSVSQSLSSPRTLYNAEESSPFTQSQMLQVAMM